MDKVPKYAYESIGDDQIRLLRWAGEVNGDSSALHLALETYTMTSARREGYVAIPYRWTDLSQAQAILLNGCSFNISRDLWLCLWNILHSKVLKGKETLVWVDSICINQHDVRCPRTDLPSLHHGSDLCQRSLRCRMAELRPFQYRWTSIA